MGLPVGRLAAGSALLFAIVVVRSQLDFGQAFTATSVSVGLALASLPWVVVAVIIVQRRLARPRGAEQAGRGSWLYLVIAAVVVLAVVIGMSTLLLTK